MKKNIFYLGLMAIAMTAVSCSKDNNTVDPVNTMPEGTADVTINETDANYAMQTIRRTGVAMLPLCRRD